MCVFQQNEEAVNKSDCERLWKRQGDVYYLHSFGFELSWKLLEVKSQELQVNVGRKGELFRCNIYPVLIEYSA
jgi:hypothetical protein